MWTPPTVYRVRPYAAILLMVVGCESNGDALTPVHGIITYKSMPLPHGTIVFTPDASRGGSGPSARAEIERDGHYVLRTGELPGVAAGWYHVTVVSVETPVAAIPGTFAVPRSLIPAKYHDPELSGLHCEVKPGKENGINLNLE